MGDQDPADFIRRLKELTGETELWENLDPVLPENEAGDELQKGKTDDEEQYDSDRSTDMILTVSNLTVKERAQLNLPTRKTKGPRQIKPNAFREIAADGPEVLEVQDASHLENTRWEESGLKEGDVSKEGETFCPWRIVRSYPSRYIGKRNRERASPFFEKPSVYDSQSWDFFYLRNPFDPCQKPILLVPTYQVKRLLEVINAKLTIQLEIPRGSSAARFSMTFGEGSTPRPRFLGRSDSEGKYNSLLANIPAIHPDDQENFKKAPTHAQEHFVTRFDAVCYSSVDNSANMKQKQRNKRRDIGRSVKHVQRFLGLRNMKCREGMVSLDLSQPLALKPEEDVIFVAIDIEADELESTRITEVGIAVLDTRDTVGVAPGEGGRNWFPLIRARHLRINKWTHIRNSRYVKGCPEMFSFGESEVVLESDIAPIIRATVNPACYTDPTTQASTQASTQAQQRNAILVFHEQSGDVDWMESMGYQLTQTTNVLEIVDTKDMDQAIRRSNNSRRLESLLRTLHIEPRYLHNAGNDAVFTMQAMIGLAVKKRLESLHWANRPATDNHTPYNEFIESGEGWSSDGEDDDGGYWMRPKVIAHLFPQSTW